MESLNKDALRHQILELVTQYGNLAKQRPPNVAVAESVQNCRTAAERRGALVFSVERRPLDAGHLQYRRH